MWRPPISLGLKSKAQKKKLEFWSMFFLSQKIKTWQKSQKLLITLKRNRVKHRVPDMLSRIFVPGKTYVDLLIFLCILWGLYYMFND